jgi:hypothetical protein
MADHAYDELGNPLPEISAESFADWSDDGLERRLVARTLVASGVVVSTLCLGSDHFGDVEPEAGEPRIYETLIIGGDRDGHLWPHATLERAQADHAAAVQLALASLEQPGKH